MARPRRNAAIPSLLREEKKEENVNNGNREMFLALPSTEVHENRKHEQEITVERYKLVVVGDEECGKTALLHTLVKSNDFEIDDSFATFDECITDVKTPQDHVEFSLYEITGMDDYRSFRMELYRGADVFLLCFDIGRPQTLHSVVNKWSSEIREEYPAVPFLLIGCKNDLRTDSAVFSNLNSNGYELPEDTESISRVKAEMVAQSIEAFAYVECCAKTRWNVDKVFKVAAEAILVRNEQKQEATTKHNSVLRRFSRLTSSNEKNHSNLKRSSIFSFVVGSNA